MASISCLEIAKFVFESGDASARALSSIRAPLKVPRDVDVRTGLEAQDPENLYVVRAWDAPESLHDMTTSLYSHPSDIMSPSSAVPNALSYRIHVHLSCEPYTALRAPLTEIVLWHLKEGVARETVEGLLTKLMKIVNEIPFNEGMYKAGWGPVLEDDRQFVVMIGWSDMEAFQTAVKNSPDGRAVLDELAVVTDRHLRHVALSPILPQQIYEARL